MASTLRKKIVEMVSGSGEELLSLDGLHNLVLKAISGKLILKKAQMAIDDFVSGYGTYKEIQETAGLSTKNTIVTIISLKKI